MVRSSGDSFKDKEALGREACKLTAIVRLRDELLRFLPGAELLPPTTMDAGMVVGLRVGARAWLAEGKDFLAAYQGLHREAVG